MKRFSLIFGFFINLIFADGGMVPPQGGYEIYSSDQVAIVKILPDSEELSILVKAYWNSEYHGFAWIVPLPSLPKLSEVDVELFTDLSLLTGPRRSEGGCSGPLGGGYFGEKSYGDDYYYVVNYDTIGFLGTVIIHTDLAESLSNWLTNNGYEIPSKAPEIFQEYIDQDWKYFFVARADTSTINYYYGQNAGVRLKFATSKIFYPMKISSISSKDATKLYLYVIGEHKFFFDDAELEYANKISSKELAAIEEDLPNLSGYIKNSDYITKLMKNFKSSDEMDEDITIYQAADDIEYRGHSSEEDYYLFGLANSLLPFLLIYIIFVGLGRIKKRRKEYE